MPTLQWMTREQDKRAAEKVPYRLLEEDPLLGYGDRDVIRGKYQINLQISCRQSIG